MGRPPRPLEALQRGPRDRRDAARVDPRVTQETLEADGDTERLTGPQADRLYDELATYVDREETPDRDVSDGSTVLDRLEVICEAEVSSFRFGSHAIRRRTARTGSRSQGRVVAQTAVIASKIAGARGTINSANR